MQAIILPRHAAAKTELRSYELVDDYLIRARKLCIMYDSITTYPNQRNIKLINILIWWLLRKYKYEGSSTCSCVAIAVSNRPDGGVMCAHIFTWTFR